MKLPRTSFGCVNSHIWKFKKGGSSNSFGAHIGRVCSSPNKKKIIVKDIFFCFTQKAPKTFPVRDKHE